jgi:hypothetical protein
MRKKLNNTELIESYKYDRKTDEGVHGTRYTFRNVHGDYLDIYLYNEDGSWCFVLDNFLMQRKRYGHDMPYYSYDEFENDLIRMNIPIPEKK